MTTKPAAPQRAAAKIVKFPDPPPEEMTAYYTVNFPGYPGSLADHFGHPETTIITSEVAAALIPTESWAGVRYPDLLIAFDADPAASIARNGYLIPEQGKPPDFVLEVASESTGRRDEGVKRDDYARMGVPEYWRFDPSGGRFHQTALAGDRLVDGEYRPIAIERTEEGHYRGYSDVLGLYLCWEDGQLRWYDPATECYLTTYLEERAARRAETERADAAEARARAEAIWARAETARARAEAARANTESARADAEAARARRLEEELRRLRNRGQL